jgi:hypothetical protein
VVDFGACETAAVGVPIFNGARAAGGPANAAAERNPDTTQAVTAVVIDRRSSDFISNSLSRGVTDVWVERQHKLVR